MMNRRLAARLLHGHQRKVLARITPESLRGTALRLAEGELPICAPSCGGAYAVVGPNAGGKSTLLRAAVRMQPREGDGACRLVSFEHHRAVLRDHREHAASRVLGRRLSHAAKYLVVRFGLYLLLSRRVEQLSTGEMRKLLLVRALSARPQLLLLDNAFDGLDARARAELRDLVGQTARGFGELLVQGVSARSTARAQLLIATHRPEELPAEVREAIVVDAGGAVHQPVPLDACADALAPARLDEAAAAIVGSWQQRPRRQGAEHAAARTGASADEPVVRMHGATVSSRDGTRLVGPLDWTFARGEHWALLGGNGAGKSSLVRALSSQPSARVSAGEGQVLGHALPSSTLRPSQEWRPPAGVAVVSTELHLETLERARADLPTAELVRAAAAAAAVPDADGWARAVLGGLGLHASRAEHPFAALSQGEQKLALLARAVAAQPALLVLDEWGQGLDSARRAHVRALLDALCAQGGASADGRARCVTQLLVVTHYADEIPGGVTHVLHMGDGGHPTFCGTRADYDDAVAGTGP